MIATYSTTIEPNCPKCGKPYVYVGDVPEGGFPKGQAPYCDGHEPDKSIFGNYGWICPVCGQGLNPYTSFCPCCDGTYIENRRNTRRLT